MIGVMVGAAERRFGQGREGTEPMQSRQAKRGTRSHNPEW